MIPVTIQVKNLNCYVPDAADALKVHPKQEVSETAAKMQVHCGHAGLRKIL